MLVMDPNAVDWVQVLGVVRETGKDGSEDIELILPWLLHGQN